MIITPGFVGCDVSKHHLDIFDGCLGRPERIANTAAAIAARLARWRPGAVFVLFEATGRYDAALRAALQAAGLAHARVNPAAARATDRLAKTDAIDARLLAAMAMALQPRPAPAPAPARERLAALALRRDQLVADRTRERNRREAAADPTVRADIDAHLAVLDQRIESLQAAVAAQLAADAELARAAALLRSLPGLGPVTATVLIAAMPELGCRNPKAIAAP